MLKRELREPTFEEWPIGEALTACLSLTRDQVAPPRERRSLDELSALGIEPSPDDLAPRLLMKGVDGREALVRHGAVSALTHCLERLGFRLGELLEMQLLCMKVLAALASCERCCKALVDDTTVSRAATDRIRPFIAHGDLTEMILAILAKTTRDAKVQAILLAELEQASFAAAVHSGVAARSWLGKFKSGSLKAARDVERHGSKYIVNTAELGLDIAGRQASRGSPVGGVASRAGGKRPGAGDLAAILAGNLDGAKEPAAAALSPRSKKKAQLEREKAAARGAALAERIDAKALSNVFAGIDVDGNGTIDKAELKRGLAQLGLPDDDDVVNALFNKYDVDKSGSIDVVEYERAQAAAEARARAARAKGDDDDEEPYDPLSLMRERRKERIARAVAASDQVARRSARLARGRAALVARVARLARRPRRAARAARATASARAAGGRARAARAGAVMEAMRYHSERPLLLCSGLTVAEQLGATEEGRRHCVNAGAIRISLDIIERFRESTGDANQRVLACALGALVCACADPRGRAKMWEDGGAPVVTVVDAMKGLPNQPSLQLRGLEMVQNLTEEAGGSRLLDELHGAWQWLCQGVPSGNELIHLHKGTLHNEGWCLGDMPHGMQAEEVDARLVKGEAHANRWTSQLLRDFMGAQKVGGAQAALDINKNPDEAYFALIQEMGLLPMFGEARDAWFARVRRYEQDNECDLRELANREYHGVAPQTPRKKSMDELKPKKKSGRKSGRKVTMASP